MDDLSAQGITGLRAARHLAGIGHLILRRGEPTVPGRDRGTRGKSLQMPAAATGAQQPRGLRAGQMPEMPGNATGPGHELAVQEQRAPNPGANGKHKHIAMPCAHTEKRFPEAMRVHVIQGAGGGAEGLLESGGKWRAGPSGERIGGMGDRAGSWVNDPGRTNTHGHRMCAPRAGKCFRARSSHRLQNSLRAFLRGGCGANQGAVTQAGGRELF